jgi:hypothetical protein
MYNKGLDFLTPNTQKKAGKMKIKTGKNLWMAALVITALFPQNAWALSAKVQQIQGEVLVAKAATPDTWDAVTADTELQSGDSVKTRQGSAVLAYTDQASFTIDANTTFTVEERAEAQDIKLLLGKIKGKVDHNRAEQPFVVTTPAAVATVRGTEVDFAFNEEGLLTVDLHNGKIDVVNDAAEMKVDLDGKKSISIQYDKEANLMRIKNECGSDGPVKFNVLGTEYSSSPCEEKEVDLSTAEEGTTPPDTNSDPDLPENPDEGREPMSETNA